MPEEQACATLRVENEKAALHVAGEDSVPHHQRATVAEGVAEPDLLTSGKRSMRMGSAKPTFAQIDQAATELETVRNFQSKPDLAVGRLAVFFTLLRYARTHCHATESSSSSLMP